MTPTRTTRTTPTPKPASDGTLTGKIIRVNADRGFCFIKGDDQQDYFCHLTALTNCTLKELQVQQAVKFTPTETPKGPRAELVETI